MSSIIEQIAEYLGANPQQVTVEMRADHNFGRPIPRERLREEENHPDAAPSEAGAVESASHREHRIKNPPSECTWGICKKAAPGRKAGDPCPFGACSRVPQGFEDGGDIHLSAETSRLDSRLQSVDMEKLGSLMIKHGVRSVRF